MTDSPSDADLVDVIAVGARQLAVDLGRVQLDRLAAYLRLIDHWNSTYNLTAVRSVRAMATQHVVDSLAVVPSVERIRGARHDLRIIDVGSGAGLPGVVLAVVLPDVDVICVDSVGKKAAFITHVASALALGNLSAIHARVEALRPPPLYGIAISRAFASLADFVSSTRHLLEPGGRWLAMKGKIPQEEVRRAAALEVRFESEVLTVPGLNADRCLLTGIGEAISER